MPTIERGREREREREREKKRLLPPPPFSVSKHTRVTRTRVFSIRFSWNSHLDANLTLCVLACCCKTRKSSRPQEHTYSYTAFNHRKSGKNLRDTKSSYTLAHCQSINIPIRVSPQEKGNRGVSITRVRKNTKQNTDVHKSAL